MLSREHLKISIKPCRGKTSVQNETWHGWLNKIENFTNSDLLLKNC